MLHTIPASKLSALLRKAPPLTSAYNRAYLASVLRTFTQIPLRGTSDTLGTLGEMLTSGQKIKTVDDHYLRKEVNKK
jgi:hypothetical protein